MILWALWSINERVAGRPGLDLPEPALGAILGDLYVIAQVEGEEYREAEREAELRRRRGF